MPPNLKKTCWLLLAAWLWTACTLGTSPQPTSPPYRTPGRGPAPAGATPPPGPSPTPTVAPSAAPPTPTSSTAPGVYVFFAINVQDFSYPDLSAALLDRLIRLHEETGVPVDIYLTDQMAAIFATDYPALWERLKASPVVAVSYHTRPPRPYASGPDWLGLSDLPANELYDTILRYETHLVNPVTGEPTAAPGGYQGVADWLGYSPYAATALAKNPTVQAAALQVFAALGARMTAAHGRHPQLGDTWHGLILRPEQVELRLFDLVGQDAASAFEAALAQAQASGVHPAFIGAKIHDNDFFATQSAWTTVYIQDRRRPPWNPDLKAPLLSSEEQAAVWALYEATVRYVAAHPEKVSAVNLPLVLAMSP